MRTFSRAPLVDSESELLVRCQRYESEALADLFDRFHDPLFQFLLARTGDAVLAEDLARETLLRALALLPRHRNRGAGIGPWLLRVANGRLAERRTSAARPTSPRVVPQLPSGGTPEADAARLRAAIDLLPRDQQEVLSLRLLGGLPVDVVARSQHRGVGATQALQARALRSLDRLLIPVAAPTA